MQLVLIKVFIRLIEIYIKLKLFDLNLLNNVWIYLRKTQKQSPKNKAQKQSPKNKAQEKNEKFYSNTNLTIISI